VVRGRSEAFNALYLVIIISHALLFLLDGYRPTQESDASTALVAKGTLVRFLCAQSTVHSVLRAMSQHTRGDNFAPHCTHTLGTRHVRERERERERERKEKEIHIYTRNKLILVSMF
jgi:hypothetical protein